MTLAAIGEFWNQTRVIANRSGTLEIENESGDDVTLVFVNGAGSKLEIPVASKGLISIGIGSDYTLSGGSLTIDGSSADRIDLDITP
ncbi:hypothetical protein [Paraliomyxa miuraensis]|uniref:hypothetical protein n=1 Tax=Paraliomyxa miuraensis TaxID=376150 RepID=UPI00225B7E5B|nr:hypothetical protein [Paraliomyxa miuraensis]MCX4241672.1 hypothetical protein [Paraliomyxa miuraensis]